MPKITLQVDGHPDACEFIVSVQQRVCGEFGDAVSPLSEMTIAVVVVPVPEPIVVVPVPVPEPDAFLSLLVGALVIGGLGRGR